MPTLAKATHQTDRNEIDDLQEIVNIGPSIANALGQIGIDRPQSLIGKDPWKMYKELCRAQREIYDPCVLDVFISVVDYMNGQPPKKWWEFTESRKQKYSAELERFSL